MHVPNIGTALRSLLLQIPHGRVTTYGALARSLGDIRASRAVGSLLSQNRATETYPCYRVIHSDGRPGKYNRGNAEKIRRLQADGISILPSGKIDLSRYGFTAFQGPAPLQFAQNEIHRYGEKIRKNGSFEPMIPRRICGIDTAYSRDGTRSCTALVTCSYPRGDILNVSFTYGAPDFPYIPGYLLFREGPLILKALQKKPPHADLLMVDGNGILHPEKAGIAAVIGLLSGYPSMGVAKSKLCGTISGTHILIDSELCGCVFHAHRNIRRPVYLSPGWRISFQNMIEITRVMSPYREPTPTRLAHREARKGIKTMPGST
ncbi:MAG: endonuclease V [Fibrobacterota bacterium]